MTSSSRIRRSSPLWLSLKAGSVKENIAKRAGSVYSADYKLIDETIEDIKKMSRKVSTSDYSANNVYIILQDAFKKVRLAEK